MPTALLPLLLVVAFAVCSWSGRTLAHHYQDWLEIAATLAVAACVLVSFILTSEAREGGTDWPNLVLGLAMSAGLVTGYMRSARSG